MDIKIRKATTGDVDAIHALISSYAQIDKMLFRSKAYIYENLQMFNVAVKGREILGCSALQVVWKDLAEIKSLAVSEKNKKQGIGKSLVNKNLQDAKELGLKKIFALTLEPKFFLKLGFEIVDKETLPMKVWSDCARCPKQDHCDETAVEIDLPNSIHKKHLLV